MRPILISLGPWAASDLPLLLAIIYAGMILWLWGEVRWGKGPPLTWRRAALAFPVALFVSLGLFLLVNRFGPIHIRAWGTMFIVAVAVWMAYTARYADRHVITPAECVDLALYCLVGMIVGARLVYVALDWRTYAAQPGHWLNVWEGGLSYHGGLIGAVVAAGIFARRRRKALLGLLDESVPGAALGYVFARIGCFLNGCCHGHECHLPWAMRFPFSEMPDTPVHPTQLYAAGASLIIFWVLRKLRGHFPRRGHLFLAYLALYSTYRFLVEFARAGATGRLLHGVPWMTIAQAASLVIFVLSITLIAATWKKPEQTLGQKSECIKS